MAKTKQDKKINKIAKQLNKELEKDVFGNRFWVRQVKKQKNQDTNSQHYLYELCDREDPSRNTLFTCGWLWGGSQFLRGIFFEQANDFIIKSNFWSIYYNDPSRYNKELDNYKKRW